MSSPIAKGRVTYPFGSRHRRYAAKYHTGDDYGSRGGGSFGKPVLATKAGRVVKAGRNALGTSYGIVVAIQTGKVRHVYAHLSAVYTKVGRTVSEGQVIGRVGRTGMVTGAHLHYEERTSPYGYWQHRKPRFNHQGRTPAPVKPKPAPKKPAPKKPTPHKKPIPRVSLAELMRAVRTGRKSNSVAVVQGALNRALKAGLKVDGYFGPKTRAAYARYQRACGFKGRDADGIPGTISLNRLGNRYRFNLRA